MPMDFHSHVLPGIDDGSADLAESMALLRLEAKQGIGHVLATPHFYCQQDYPADFLRRRDAAEAALRREMEAEPALPALSVGAEVYYFRGMSESEFLPQLTIRGKRCILIEMPDPPWTEAMYRELEAIWRRREILPVIAHIDRYISPFRTYRIPRQLAELPVLVQANASFFLSRSTVAMALKMLKEDQIHLLGSDCHNVRSRRPDLGEALALIEKKLGPRPLDAIREYEEQVFAL